MSSTRLNGPELSRILAELIPEAVQDAVAVAVLSGERSATVEVQGEPVEFQWASGRELGFEDRARMPARAPSSRPEDADRIEAIQRVGVLVMRCLPDFQNHPVIRLVPKRTYAMPSKLLPQWYVDRFRDHPTQLDSNCLFKYHQSGSGYFQLPHSNPAFQVVWRSLWEVLESGQMG